MVQVFIDKTMLSFNATGTVSYLDHPVLLNISKRCQRSLIDHGHTLVMLLAVAGSESSTDAKDTDAALEHSYLPLSELFLLSIESPATSSRGARDMRIKVLNEPMNKFLVSLKENSRQVF